MRKGFVFASAVCVLLMLMFAPLTAGALDMEINRHAFILTGTVTDGSAGLFASPNSKQTAIGRLKKGETIRVVGQEGSFYEAVWEGRNVYVARGKLRLTGNEGPETDVSPVVTDCSAKMTHVMVRHYEEAYIAFEGTISLSKPVDQVVFFIYDERRYNVEYVSIQRLDAPTDVLDMTAFRKAIPTDPLLAGRKTLTLQAVIDGEETVLWRVPFFASAIAAKDPPNLTGKCTFSVNGARMVDYRLDSVWAPTSKRPEMVVTLPEKERATLLQMEWATPPQTLTVTIRDASGAVISAETKSTSFYMDAVSLPANAAGVTIRPEGGRPQLASVRVWGTRYPRDVVQQWTEIPDKLDMLIFSAHQDDEWLFFGGAIPWACERGKEVAMVYMAGTNRTRIQEALDGLWTGGLRHHPIFLGYRDAGVHSLEVAASLWEGSQTAIVRLIRRYRPDVILVQDAEGEYGHTQHKLTSLQVREGVLLAADPDYDLESAAEYGVWDTPKLYVHLWPENQITMDWDVPLEETGTITPWELALEAFDKHRTQQGYFRVEYHGALYDNHVFGLCHTTVGPDVTGGDFFENLP
ncbi:MAG: PIG-L family deacetylase [Clostridia bacterium]|nr:PIG-L family deacetylase [Clostridia bacterium]